MDRLLHASPHGGDDSEHEDRVPLLALMTEYLAITYKHCEPQSRTQSQRPSETAHAEKDEPRESTCLNDAAAARRVLTKRAEPAGNGGFDNEDRNLIVRVRDVLGSDDAASSHCTAQAPSATRSSSVPGARYIVLDLLGQGTFGQVFRCQHELTKQIVAVKVIRNHPSYYKQALVEVQITRMLNRKYGPERSQHIVRLLDSFEYRGHLCLVFELLSMNVYELITENNFTGFPMDVTRGFVTQLLQALVQIADAGVIHCDLKPENILLAGQDRLYEDAMAPHGHHQCHERAAAATPLLKVVDFGSACLENETVYSYIQSRFYRSPEVLLGIPYTRAIDMWSLGCIAFEMLLGLPLFPGVSEHDQLRLIEETLGKLPQYLLRKGRNVLKFYDVRTRPNAARSRSSSSSSSGEFVLKSPEQFAEETSSEVRTAKKYFKYSKLDDLVYAYPFREHATPGEHMHEMERRQAFLDFLSGLLVADPAARWTAREALEHPFITGERFLRDAAPLYEQVSELSRALVLPQPPDVLAISQQQQQAFSRHPSEYTPVAMLQQHDQVVMPLLPLAHHQRVCPIDPYYVDASYPYYANPVYAYDQPWTPTYAPAPAYAVADGASSFHYEPPSYPLQYDFGRHDQPHANWTAPSYEAFVPPPTAQRMTQKVMPASPTRSAVMPMHSPQYSSSSSGQRLDATDPCPFPHSYDPPREQPLSRQHPASVAPVDPPVFQTPPKLRHPRNSAQPKSGGGRGARRRRPAQPRISDLGMLLPNLGPATTTVSSSSAVLHLSPTVRGDGDGRRQWIRNRDAQTALGPPAPASHPHRSKRRSEQTPEDAHSDLDRRLWKSPRGANDAADSRFARASLRHDLLDTRDGSGACDSGHCATTLESDALELAEPHYVFAPPAPALPT